jgi:CHASE2 domain-containing sensor protein
MKRSESQPFDVVRRALVRSLIFGLAIAAICLFGGFTLPDALVTDALMRRRPELFPDQRVVVVGITDECLQTLGQWPWPRAHHAKLLDRIRAARPTVVLWDMVFGEPSRAGPADDAQLATALTASGSVILPITMASSQVAGSPLTGMSERHGTIEVSRGLTAIPSLNAAAAAVGHVYFREDFDGIVRSFVPALRVGDRTHLAFPLIAAARVAGIKVDPALADATPLLRALQIPTGPGGRVPINFLGKSQSAFEILPYHLVLGGEVEERAFENRVVLVGGASVGLHDQKATPVGTMYGLEILAHATSNLLARNSLKVPSTLDAALLALLAALVAGLATALLGPVRGTLLTLFGLGGWAYLAILLFRMNSRGLPVTGVAAAALLGNLAVVHQTLFALLRRRREEAESRRKIEETLTDAERDFESNRVQLGFERLSALPELTGELGLRARTVRLRGLLRKTEELELETFLNKEELPTLPREALLNAAGELEERARYDLAELVFNALKATSGDTQATMEIEDSLERVTGLKKKAGLASPLLPLARKVLGDDYQKVVFLGVGGMGFVIKALWKPQNRWVAVKFLSPTFVQHKEIRERFERETKILSGLKHPNVIEVLSHAKGEHPYYSMEFFSGRSLGELLQSNRVLSLAETARIIIPTARALAYAHEQNLVHRDVKPGNVLLGPDGVVKLMDFGIAKSFEMTDLTPTGEMLGTPDYMSPEQVQGETKKMMYLTDVYALGVLVYEMLTGQLPFPRGAHPFMRVSTPPQPVLEHGVAIPKPVADLIMLSLSTEMDDRKCNCLDFVTTLEPYLSK